MAETSPAFLLLLAEFRTYPAAYQWAGAALLTLPLLLQAIFCVARWVMVMPTADGLHGSRAPLTIYVIVVLALLLAAAYSTKDRSEVLLFATILVYFSVGCAVWVGAGFMSGCVEGDALDEEGEEAFNEMVRSSQQRKPVTPLRKVTQFLARRPPRAVLEPAIDPPRKKLVPRMNALRRATQFMLRRKE